MQKFIHQEPDKLLHQETDNTYHQLSIENLSQLFNKACLDAIHWWIHREYKYHISFTHSKNDLQSSFLQFTKDYSVFTRIESNKRLEILNKLQNADFIKNISIDGSELDLDSYLHLTETSYEREKDGMLIRSYHLSMLTKFATLINPEEFTMLDTNAVTSLGRILEAYDFDFSKSQLKKDYSYFKTGFDHYSEIVKQYRYYTDLTSHYNYLKDNFKEYPISETAFQNRVLDKFLWHMHNEKVFDDPSNIEL
ncbi:MAG: hypothetical protein ACJATI_003219 [Halioglobus sp.]|jgi:hypothetical protein